MLTFENKHYILTLGEDCAAKSLIHKATGEECLGGLGNVPFFSLTEERPYNNEIKLAHPNKRTTFGANRVRREGDRLIVGFELVTFEAIVDVKIADDYIAFSLADFIIRPDDFGTPALCAKDHAEKRLHHAGENGFPSVTLPCHMSLFLGVPAERHGVTTNLYTPPPPPNGREHPLYKTKDRSIASVFCCKTKTTR